MDSVKERRREQTKDKAAESSKRRETERQRTQRQRRKREEERDKERERESLSFWLAKRHDVQTQCIPSLASQSVKEVRKAIEEEWRSPYYLLGFSQREI